MTHQLVAPRTSMAAYAAQGGPPSPPPQGAAAIQTTHLAFLIGYLVLMLGIGGYFSWKSKLKTGDDFMYAGRRLPRIVLIGTLLATWVGSGTIVGGANFLHTYGPGAYIFFVGGTPVGILLLWLMSRKIRENSGYTIPELLEAHFGSAVRFISAIVVFMAYVGLSATQLIGGGYILSLVTPLTATQGTLLAAVVVTFLTISGGMFSVAWTDALSAGIIILTLLASLPIVFSHVGSIGDYFAKLPGDTGTLTGGLGPMQLLGFFMPLLLLVLADQNLYQRLGAAPDANQARKSTFGFLIGSLFIVVPVGFLGGATIILMPNLENPDTALLSLATEGYMPLAIGGLFLAAALAFIVTTATSYLLSVGGNLLYDFYIRFKKEEVGDSTRLKLHRLAVLIVALLAYLIGQFFPTALELQVYSYTVYGVAIVPVVMAVFFWRRATTTGAIACMVSSSVSLIVWEFALGKPYGWNGVLIAFPIGVVALIVFSLATKPRTNQLQPVAARESA